MSAAELIARGDPVTPGLPSELEILAWLVGGVVALVAAVVLALYFAQWRHGRQPEDPERTQEADVAYFAGLHSPWKRGRPALMRGERGRVVIYPELSQQSRTAGRHRDAGRHRMS